MVEDRPDPGQWTLLLRQVDQAVRSPGQLGVVTLSGANLHDLRTGAGGASFVDVFTVYREPARSRQVVLGPPVADAGALRTARWGTVM